MTWLKFLHENVICVRSATCKQLPYFNSPELDALKNV